jgi:hypothetical protein
MSKNLHSTHLRTSLNKSIVCFAILLCGMFTTIAQTTTTKELQGFDERKVLDEFRKKEGSEIKYAKAYANFLEYKKQEFIGKKNGTWQKSIPHVFVTATAGACGNIDFETGDLSGWSGKTGSNPGCCGSNGFVSNGVNAAANDPNGRHTIMTGGGMDPCGGFPVIAPAMPGYVQGTYSCRLGNAVNGAEAESIETVFTPSASNNVFTYQYATVLENPGHAPADQPFFKVEILDQNGQPIPNYVYSRTEWS